MDKIMARGLTFSGCHGVLPEEKTKPQTFIVDLDLFLDLKPAGISDNLQDTVSYAEVFAQVRQIVEDESYNLLEALAENIATALIMRHPLTGVEVTVYKPDAPIKGEFTNFAVNIQRFRK
ncbi:Dihydroneopterin aldolase [Syntrophomonas zehnderi OL-4]|uniref:7,8-dihydroneopterin aldolase n=1 Tax=Syntrophomonas zehnderi OL-4 TaxID=690567 RepID=A0A0E4GAE7_9FIRM|nr:Dihydroneopterin aldolase [Syntrophomonas zehnderi OL-4]